MKKENIKKLTFTSIFGAVGFVLMLLEFPLPMLIPSFIKLDFSEIPAVIVSFSYGPWYGVLVCLLKNLLHLFVTTTNGAGEASNFLLGAIFVGVTGFLYQYKKTRCGALVASIVGALVMAVISIATNYFIMYPLYSLLYGLPIDAIINMYKALLPYSDTLIKSLIIFNLPFNFIKGILDCAVCFIIYKKISPILKFKREKDC